MKFKKLSKEFEEDVNKNQQEMLLDSISKLAGSKHHIRELFLQDILSREEYIDLIDRIEKALMKAEDKVGDLKTNLLK